MSRPTKPLQDRTGFHSLIITVPPVAYVWYGGNRIFIHVTTEDGGIQPNEFESFEFDHDDHVGVLFALEAINCRLEDDEVAWTRELPE